MNKISSSLETIFSYAVALDQSGKLRNTIHISGKDVFILNQDKSVLLRFTLPAVDKVFDHDISFLASDYDSSTFQVDGDKVQFIKESGGFIRTKTCGSAEVTVGEVREIWGSYDLKKVNQIQLHKNLLTHLDTRLSHTEIWGVLSSGVSIVQRNIYDGTHIEINRKNTKSLSIVSPDDIQEDFGPVGMRTGDLIALFSFDDVLTFYFVGESWCWVVGRNLGMLGVVSLCRYDELGGVGDSRCGVEEEKPQKAARSGRGRGGKKKEPTPEEAPKKKRAVRRRK